MVPLMENSIFSYPSLLSVEVRLCQFFSTKHEQYLTLRDGYCRTDSKDHGVHVVCATMTKNFLKFTKAQGNDLSTKRGSFPGLNPGDRWCLCATRWREAMVVGSAPLVNIKATHQAALKINTVEELMVNQVTSQHIIDLRKNEL